MVNIQIIPRDEYQRIQKSEANLYDKLKLIATMCRFNTLNVVKRAGSGHLGSSFSAMDIVVWLYYKEMNTIRTGLDNPDRDIYFSSKGHDVPGLYSVLYSLGVIPKEKYLKLRRFGGCDGHPDVGVRGIEANSGSLGMGISKGKGMAWAKTFKGNSGRVFVMTGDGEFQEGQNFEAMQSAVQDKIGNLFVIMDHNKVQSDKLVNEIVSLGDLNQKFKSFGWHVTRCQGHDFQQISKCLEELSLVTDCPKILIADTIKGKGVSFMEHPVAMQSSKGLYAWHAGAPDDNSFEAAKKELKEQITTLTVQLGLESITFEDVEPEIKIRHFQVAQNLAGEPVSQAAQAAMPGKVTDEYVAKAFGQTLSEIGSLRKDLVVLDGDLAADCRIRDFEEAYPDRFIENGIAEQDMVSMAGGLARQGLLPVVNSFASFLSSRANEQIYNNASENTKIIYACHYSGLIPAGPGKSHQSIRDISLLGAIPNMVILQPCNTAETQMVVEYCVQQATSNCVIRLAIGPSPRLINLPEDYTLTYGQGVALNTGNDGLLFAYGPVMLNEALLASEILLDHGYHLKIINMPWLNRIDKEWFAQTVNPYNSIFVLDDHSPVGGLGDYLLNALIETDLLSSRKAVKFAVEGYPACGTPSQALEYHQLDGVSLSKRILRYE